MFVTVAALALALQTSTPAAASPPPAPSGPTASGHPPEGAMHGLIVAFDVLCNRAFPDDVRLDTAMSHIATFKPLPPEQVRIYLKDDPGHGWVSDNGTSHIVVTIESPPFHACAVRMPHTGGQIDETMWRQVIAAAEARAGGGFAAMAPKSFDVGDVRSTAIGDQRRNPDGSAEAFYLFRTKPIDPAKAPGYGVELRLVHQFVAANAR